MHTVKWSKFYFKQFNLAWFNKVKWFQVLLCITKNSIKHQSFVYTQLNDKTVLLQTTQFNIYQFNMSIQFNICQFNICQFNSTHVICLHSNKLQHYSFVEMQLVYSTVTADWAESENVFQITWDFIQLNYSKWSCLLINKCTGCKISKVMNSTQDLISIIFDGAEILLSVSLHTHTHTHTRTFIYIGRVSMA